MEAVIRKCGNSPAFRLSTALLKKVGYQLEQKVGLLLSLKCIVAQPTSCVEYDLDALLNGVTK